MFVIRVVLTIKIFVICVGVIMCIKVPLMIIVVEGIPDMYTYIRTLWVTHLRFSNI